MENMRDLKMISILLGQQDGYTNIHICYAYGIAEKMNHIIHNKNSQSDNN